MTTPVWFAGFNVIPQVMEEKAANTPLPSVGRMIVLSIGLAAACLLMLIVSLYQPYVSAEGSIPLEWIFLLVFGGLGVAFWLLGGKIRRAVGDSERRQLILGAAVVRPP